MRQAEEPRAKPAKSLDWEFARQIADEQWENGARFRVCWAGEMRNEGERAGPGELSSGISQQGQGHIGVLYLFREHFICLLSTFSNPIY